jgi:hypothetical protein
MTILRGALFGDNILSRSISRAFTSDGFEFETPVNKIKLAIKMTASKENLMRSLVMAAPFINEIDWIDLLEVIISNLINFVERPALFVFVFLMSYYIRDYLTYIMI